MKQFFFSRKLLTITALVVVALYLVLAIAPFYIHEYRAEHIKEAAQQTHAAQQAKLSPEEKAIQKAEDYLITNFGTIKTPQRLFLDYLQRKFDAPTQFSVKTSPMEFPGVESGSPQEIDLLARIAYPDKIVHKLPAGELDALSYTNIYGANCDHLKLPKEFWKVVDRQIKNGGYHLTHIALMLAMMKDNNCAKPSDIDDIKAAVTGGMKNIADDPNVSADLKYEAIAFLMLIERHDEVKPEWIKRIVSDQNDDGSWSTPESYQDIDHTTLLAYWALLEYQHPNQPYVPIIRRPS